MRLRGMLVLGALTIGAMACGDALAPPAGGAKDLEFVLPAAQGALPGATRYRTWDEPVTEAELAKLPQAQRPNLTIDATGGGTGGGAQVLPVIFSKYAAGAFDEDDFTIQYGMFGFGSGYTMTPSVRITGPQGNTLLQQQGTGRTEDAPIYWYMRPHVEEAFRIPTSCGATAELKVLFEVRVGLPGIPFVRTQESNQGIVYQRACPAPVTSSPLGGGGSLPLTTYDGLYICYYEVWVDLDGAIVDVIFLRCDQIRGPIQMA